MTVKFTGQASAGSQDAPAPILSVRNLTVRISAGAQKLAPVTDVSFDVMPGEIVGLVGESGSGKSLTSLALTRLLPDTAEVSGAVNFDGRDLLTLDSAKLRQVRGAEISYVFQDPQAALNPLMTCGRQISEIIRRHRATTRAAALARSIELLDAVGIREPAASARKYPHELSGGQRQRVMVAIALACEPKVIVADEATTALDVAIQRQVIELFRSVRDHTGASLILISHDLELVSGLADRILVMYGGRILERGRSVEVVGTADHPYTQGLIRSIPTLRGPKLARFGGIDGVPPNPSALPPGCPFAPRCPRATTACESMPRLTPVSENHQVACWHAGPARDGDLHIDTREIVHSTVPDSYRLEVTDLSVRFNRRRGPRGLAGGGIEVVSGVSVSIGPGQIVGMVGESGSGKTSFARALTGIVRPAGGQISYDARTVFPPPRRTYRPPRAIQMVFQDPYASLNPRMKVSDLVAEAYDMRMRKLSHHDRDDQVIELLERVGIDPEFRQRYPHQFSGGQRQRIAIARALAAEPELLVCDEAVSSLDVSIRAHVLNVLLAERERSGLSIVFIAHDLSVVRHLADTVVVLNQGRVVEAGETETVIFSPQHSYTRELLAATGAGLEVAGTDY